METALRTALIAWLRADPALAALNAIEEESPLAASPPWLGLAASASIDWSTKDLAGREVRIALELTARGDDPEPGGALAGAIEARALALPAAQPGFQVVTTTFLRARSERRARNLRSVLIEIRFRILATETLP